MQRKKFHNLFFGLLRDKLVQLSIFKGFCLIMLLEHNFTSLVSEDLSTSGTLASTWLFHSFLYSHKRHCCFRVMSTPLVVFTIFIREPHNGQKVGNNCRMCVSLTTNFPFIWARAALKTNRLACWKNLPLCILGVHHRCFSSKLTFLWRNQNSHFLDPSGHTLLLKHLRYQLTKFLALGLYRFLEMNLQSLKQGSGTPILIPKK